MTIRKALLHGVLVGMAVLALSSARQAENASIKFAVLTENGALRQPRILTVLTTYNRRTPLVKEYKEAVLDRQDGYHPAIFAVSNLDDEDPHGVIDFKVGSPRHHRSIAAIAEATLRYAGTFDWIALGDDDTVFMYNRAMNFLSNIDHTKPVIFGRVDGLNSTGRAERACACFSPEMKMAPPYQHGCCRDFANPCEVPVFPPDSDFRHRDHWSEYGPNGLYWPYGGSGVFLSAGLAVDVVGVDGWALCARMFTRMNTDIQIAQCLKMHGYSVGAYPEGFDEMQTPTPGAIRRHLADNCKVLGVHLGIRHLANHRPYTPKMFGAAIAAVREADTLSARDGEDPDSLCHEWWESFPE